MTPFWKNYHFYPQRGDEGNLIPFSASSDDMVVIVLMVVLVVATVAFMRILPFMKLQSKYITYTEKGRFRGQANISREILYGWIIEVMACVSMSLVAWLYMLDNYSLVWLMNKVMVVGGIGLALIAYLLIKRVVYLWTNSTFQESNNIKQWNRFSLFISTSEMLLLLPVAYVLVFLGVSYHFVIIYTIFVVFLAKIFTFYKQTRIFFRQTGGFLQNILYFCALEIIPLLMGAGIVTMINS